MTFAFTKSYFLASRVEAYGYFLLTLKTTVPKYIQVDSLLVTI